MGAEHSRLLSEQTLWKPSLYYTNMKQDWVLNLRSFILIADVKCWYIQTPHKLLEWQGQSFCFCHTLITFGFKIRRWMRKSLQNVSFYFWCLHDHHLQMCGTTQDMTPFVWNHPFPSEQKILQHVTWRCFLIPRCCLFRFCRNWIALNVYSWFSPWSLHLLW